VYIKFTTQVLIILFLADV